MKNGSKQTNNPLPYGCPSPAFFFTLFSVGADCHANSFFLRKIQKKGGKRKLEERK